jgi:hypothetical protein
MGNLCILWHVPLLGNDSVNTFPRQLIRRQQSITSVSMQRRCKYNNRGSGVFVGPPRHSMSSTEQNQIRTRMERVLGSQGSRVRLKIYCVIIIDCYYEWSYKKVLINPKSVIISHRAINTWQYIYWMGGSPSGSYEEYSWIEVHSKDRPLHASVHLDVVLTTTGNNNWNLFVLRMQHYAKSWWATWCLFWFRLLSRLMHRMCWFSFNPLFT